MAQIRKTHSGSWETTIYLGLSNDGKRRYKHLTAKSKSELTKQIQDVLDHRDDADVMGMTVGLVVQDYIQKRESWTGDNALSPSTIGNYYKYLNSDLYRNLEKVKIGKLSKEIVQRAIDNYAKDHSPKSVSLRWGLIRAALAEIRKDFSLDVRLPKIKRKRLEMPEKDKLQSLFSELRGKDMEIPVLLGAICGLRRGEISALDLHDDVDYDRGIISVNKDMVLDKNKQYVIKKPKTDAAIRQVQCPAWVLDRLAEARDSSEYRINLPNSITTGWHRLSQKHGISCSFHGLRHYFASVMDSLNVPESYQMERMGHATNYTLKRYQEYLKETEYDVNVKMNSYFSSLDPNDATKNATSQFVHSENDRKQGD